MPIKKTKLIEKVDDKIWNIFRAYCIKNRIIMGNTISDILEDFLKKKGELN